VPVDGFRYVGGLVAYGVADVLDRHAVVAHDAYGGVAALVSVPVADARPLGHLAEAVVECPSAVQAAVLVTEDQVVVLPKGFRFFPLGLLPDLVGLERGYGPLGSSGDLSRKAIPLRACDRKEGAHWGGEVILWLQQTCSLYC
jgi:hypothetical protein